jgi:multidrug efflux system membrane fusion protein
LPVTVLDRANTTQLATGTLIAVDTQIDTTTGTVKLRAQFDNADGALFPNQFVNVQLLEETLANQVILPTAAVRRGAPNGVVGTFAYVVKSDDTVEVRPITLGIVDGERAAVSTGLAVGERVVTEGGDRLRDGAKVSVPQAGASAPDAAPRAPSPPSDARHPHRAGTPPGAHP